MQIFHKALFAARARIRQPSGEKKASRRPATTLSFSLCLSLPRHPLGVPFFSFCRRCPTWRYVKRIYNWRYDGRALESNTSILIPATYAVHPNHPAHAPLSLSGRPLECQSAPWPIGFYRVDIEFIPHSRERSGGKYAGRDEQKRILLDREYHRHCRYYLKLTTFVFCSMYMRNFPYVRLIKKRVQSI